MNARGNSSMTTSHNGWISGTNTLLLRRFDGVSWAVLFNANHTKDGKDPTDVINAQINAAADAVTKWPEGDLFNKLGIVKS